MIGKIKIVKNKIQIIKIRDIEAKLHFAVISFFTMIDEMKDSLFNAFSSFFFYAGFLYIFTIIDIVENS